MANLSEQETIHAAQEAMNNVKSKVINSSSEKLTDVGSVAKAAMNKVKSKVINSSSKKLTGASLTANAIENSIIESAYFGEGKQLILKDFTPAEVNSIVLGTKNAATVS